MTWYQILALCTCAPYAFINFAYLVQMLTRPRHSHSYSYADAILLFVAATLTIVSFIGVK